MTKEEIKENNNLIAFFMGFKYRYLAEEDYSDCGGLYTIVEYYSNKSLVFEYWGKNGEPNNKVICLIDKDFKYIIIEIGGYSSFGFNKELLYHIDWNYLISVIHKVQIEIDKLLVKNKRGGWTPEYGYLTNFNKIPITAPIEEVYYEVVRFIKNYNNEK